MSNNHHDIVRLNVGGQHFVTTRTTLCAEDGSLLSHMFRSDSQFASPIETSCSIVDDDHANSKSTNGREVFLDRDPYTLVFGTILNYLRDGCLVVVDLSNKKEILQRLRTDADYFSLEGLIVYCDTKLNLAAESARREKENLNKVYDYCRLNECTSPGPGWKLLKVTPRRHVFGCIESDCEDSDCSDHQKWEQSFVFEKEQQQETDTDTAVKKERMKYHEYELTEKCKSPDGPGWKLWDVTPPQVWDEWFIFERITMAEEEESSAE
mmetsp:Transcript_13149/g.14414  ORF Transcript_13149/g.14414 Transcript_13149/m.14414 type:complete len:266 (-) Transcript_13149:113-910(-)|eukprot:CAMPEP_0170798688 /NCGR_PEP_ID=MMETSP0733-20121128/26518_1 /TAXON_ID=186038 /ORGANISM="Fragilariopsis kerguelensis, Strain L26-C5" /LENGTH=265 /DNA_ID=CAMNT_0011150115 /DNA_START=148 /DNA_END=945 /DNA_ORIENTATION=-